MKVLEFQDNQLPIQWRREKKRPETTNLSPAGLDFEDIYKFLYSHQYNGGD